MVTRRLNGMSPAGSNFITGAEEFSFFISIDKAKFYKPDLHAINNSNFTPCIQFVKNKIFIWPASSGKMKQILHLNGIILILMQN